ncbi:SDR family NAD(P)-dependent oxidoreductase [Nonomuraea sediminis]|uniref:SDR family NAD(P)-dependent oxidoreductase n=1 Tax=Nonomuraea sediminis TaxID=2835864 RepID=UPI001BDCA802|nr:SDR family NAD(P)-dependent oxidoreductase [Nonomuraea sediminis]
MDLNGKTALVTGGTRGIGRAIVLALARAGANVVTCSLSGGEGAIDLSRELKELPGEHRVIRADVRHADEVASLVEECRAGLDVVVHNAGVISHLPVEGIEPDEWHRIVDTHLTGAYQLVRATLPLLGEGSSIIGIGSRVAAVGLPQRTSYTAAKLGMVGFFRSLAKELGPRGIRVNIVEPGVIETEAANSLSREQYDALQARYRQLTSLGRLGTPDEVADVVLFLAGSQSRYVTGSVIRVDGGI